MKLHPRILYGRQAARHLVCARGPGQLLGLETVGALARAALIPRGSPWFIGFRLGPTLVIFRHFSWSVDIGAQCSADCSTGWCRARSCLRVVRLYVSGPALVQVLPCATGGREDGSAKSQRGALAWGRLLPPMGSNPRVPGYSQETSCSNMNRSTAKPGLHRSLFSFCRTQVPIAITQLISIAMVLYKKRRLVLVV